MRNHRRVPLRRSGPLWRIGIDTGGTFTDLLALGPGETLALKVLTTPRDPSLGVLRALQRFFEMRPGARIPPVGIVHGSTIATNALLENKGCKVAFVTNEGFEDLIEIGRQNRHPLYDLHPRKPAVLVPRDHRIGVGERTLADGTRLTKPSPRELERAWRRIRVLAPDAIAVGFLHSYSNPAAEQEIGRFLSRRGCALVCLSSVVAPRIREFERYSTAIANAFLLPSVQSYLQRLGQAVHPHRLYVMQSSGGLTSAADAASLPVRLVMSGPAGGMAAAERFMKSIRRQPRAVSFDMGGTSTDVGLIDGKLKRTDQIEVGGRPLLVDSIDLVTIGAGGGSILWVDAAGALRVGPVSAGADPGPACYGKALVPCLTDAHVVLGRIPAMTIVGEGLSLHGARSRRALEPLARRLCCSVDQIAAASLDIADAAMEKAIKKITLERGVDPRELLLFAFGGAGGLHACRLARRLGMLGVVIPPFPGAISAFGMASSDARIDLVQGVVRTLGTSHRLERGALLDLHRVRALLERQGRRRMLDQLGPGGIRIESRLALRYRGQSHELVVPFRKDFAKAFVRLHQRRFGFALDHAFLESVAVETAAIRKITIPHSPPEMSQDRRSSRAGLGRTVVETPSGGLRARRIPIYRRVGLCSPVAGPCILLDPTATVFVEPGFRARPDQGACLLLEPARRKRQNGTDLQGAPG